MTHPTDSDVLGTVPAEYAAGSKTQLARSGAKGSKRHGPESSSAPWARGLGWFSIGLGLTELLAPRPLARAIGLNPRHAAILPWLGVRELVSGIGILAHNGQSAPWVKSRVLGDAIDLGLLSAALASSSSTRTRVALATAAVASITALDVFCSAGSTGAAMLASTRRNTRSVTILRPAAELYAYWRKLENLPRVLSHLESVDERDRRTSHWVAKGPADIRIEWDARIVEEQLNDHITWSTVGDSEITHRGSISFRELGESRGTLVSVQLEYEPPAGPLGAALLKLLGQAPEQQLANDLRRWKQLLETGEISTTEGQPAGRRSLLARALP